MNSLGNAINLEEFENGRFRHHLQYTSVPPLCSAVHGCLHHYCCAERRSTKRRAPGCCDKSEVSCCYLVLSCLYAGIRCTNIAPGEVATDILDQRPIPPSAERRKLMLNPSDVGDMAVAVAKLPAVAHVTEIIMTGKTTVPQAVL